MSTSAARAWVEIDLPAIDRNVGRIKQALPPHVRYVAVVKANAYGHGMPEVATRLLQAGVDCFAVANVAEAAILREIGHDADILLLSPTLPTELARAVALGLDITLNSLAEAQALAALVRGRDRRAKVHVKVDTGMGRAGVWHEQAAELFANAFTSAPIAVSDLTSAPVTMGVINPSSVATATHTSTPSNDFAAIVFASHPAFNAGTSRNARPTAYITQSFTLTFTP